MPILVKKDLHELKIVSIILFACILIFVALFIIQLLTIGNIDNHDENYGRYYKVEFSMQLVTSVSIFLVAFVYHFNFFSVIDSLAEPTRKNVYTTVAVAITNASILYGTLGVLSIYMFGSILSSDVLNNVGQEHSVSSYIIRFSFLLVLACHIPYIFFPAKESFLIIVDEIRNQSMSKAIEMGFQTDQIGEVLDTNAHNGKKETPKENKMAYKEMEPLYYYGITLGIYLVINLGAIFIEDVTVIFEAVGAIGCGTIGFIFPGWFYLLMEKKYASETHKKEHWGIHFAAIVWIVIGVTYMILAAVNQFIPE